MSYKIEYRHGRFGPLIHIDFVEVEDLAQALACARNGLRVVEAAFGADHFRVLDNASIILSEGGATAAEIA